MVPKQTSPCLLTIAGSDPSGGAGIQADLKTMSSLGCYAAAAITALTCQNSLGVSAVSPVEPQIVHDQIRAVLDDMPISHIKIGMTASAEICAAITAATSNFNGEIVFDPVLRASSGQLLQDSTDVNGLTPLLQRSTVLTPNRFELEILSGLPVANLQQARQAGKKLLSTLPLLRALCIKGGHLCEEEAEIVDLLLVRTNATDLEDIEEECQYHPRLKTMNSHGTGCTFASAFTAFHARSNNYVEAFTRTVIYLATLLSESRALKISQGNGPLLHHLMN